MLVSASGFSYYNLIKAKDNAKSKKIFLFPEDVKLIKGEGSKYIQLFFDEETYGMDSYSFAKHLVGEELMLFETKYRKKTCACKTSGTFFKGYFILTDNNIMKIDIDKKQNIKNKAQLYNFVSENSELGLPENINTIDNIIDYLKNINK